VTEQPLYFGPARAPRFGVYHPSQSPSAADRGAVICPPLGHEYFRAHRACRTLASALGRAGVPVLRFDYVGSGDSAGTAAEGGVPEWLADIDAAVEELKRNAPIRRVSLIGLRFGATLAALASERRTDVDWLALWDPVLSGAAYLRELETLQQGWLRDRLGAGSEQLLAGQPERLGMPLSEHLVQQLEAIDLRRRFVPPPRTAIVMSSPQPECLVWQQQLAATGAPVSIACVPSPGDWLNPEAVHQLLFPHAIVKALAELVTAG
jgi:alpha/beta superfamily hydrolase